MALTNCDPADGKCLDELVQEINDELTIACQIPFTVPKKELVRIINRAKKYFYKIYEDSVEEMYIALPGSAFSEQTFRRGIEEEPLEKKLTEADLKSTRGIVKMPDRVYSVNAVYEIGHWSGEDGGYGGMEFSAGDPDFSVDKFIYSDVYGAGIGSDNLLYYVVNMKFLDNTRQVLQAPLGYTYNRLTHDFRFTGRLPRRSCIFQIYSTIPDCDLFQDDAFIRYCIAKAKIQLSRILGTFNFNLPGNITINYDLVMSEGQAELDSLIEEIKGDEGVDYFFTA
jgi:hypothetical protein